MKTIAVMQPYLFPYIGYYQLLNNVDSFVVYDDVNFIKKGWIHRNQILSNNKALMFSTPLTKPSQNKLICDTLISVTYDEWKEKFLKTLHHSYCKAPHFNQVFTLVSDVLHVGKAGHSISWLALESLIKVAEYLKLTAKIVRTSRIYENTHLKAQDRILDICKQENADAYLNLIGGMALYNPEDFKSRNLKLSFCHPNGVIYSQFKEFTPNLSIIDVLMFNSIDETIALLNKCQIVSPEKL